MKNMYAAILKCEAFDIIKAKLTWSNKFKTNEVNEIINCVNITINQNYFTYDK